MLMTQEELTQLMADSAQNAIETTMEEFGLKLDCSEKSVELIDDIILSWLDKYKEQILEENAVFTICNIYGAYLGEIFRKKVGGNWSYDESNLDAPYVVIHYAGNSYAFAGICYQRLVNDSQISISNYFDQAVSHNIQ